MKYVYAALLALVAIAAYAADPVSLQQMLQSSPKETSPQGQTSIVTVRGGVVRRFSLMSTAKLVPVATASSPGVVKVGTGLAVTADGTLNNTGVAGVASFNGRGGAVTPATGDYSIGQISGAATVASTGSYADLFNKPAIPAAQVNSDWAASSGVAQILNKPVVPSSLSQLTQSPSYRTVTDAEKTQWNNNSSPVQSFNGRTGAIMPQSGDYTSVMVGADALGSATSVQTNLTAHTGRTDNPHSVTKAQVGLTNVDNTSDLAKPISTAVQSALDAKANTTALGTAAAKNIAATGNASSTEVVMGNDTRLSDSRPASDVSTWAKAATKPTYTASEVGAVSTTGNAATATKLLTPRTINGVAFDGTANITITDSTKLSDAPSDGSAYARKDGAWAVVGSGTISSSTPTTLASGSIMASSGTLIRPATAADLRAIVNTAPVTANRGILLFSSAGCAAGWQTTMASEIAQYTAVGIQADHIVCYPYTSAGSASFSFPSVAAAGAVGTVSTTYTAAASFSFPAVFATGAASAMTAAAGATGDSAFAFPTVSGSGSAGTFAAAYVNDGAFSFPAVTATGAVGTVIASGASDGVFTFPGAASTGSVGSLTVASAAASSVVATETFENAFTSLPYTGSAGVWSGESAGVNALRGVYSGAQSLVVDAIGGVAYAEITFTAQKSGALDFWYKTNALGAGYYFKTKLNGVDKVNIQSAVPTFTHATGITYSAGVNVLRFETSELSGEDFTFAVIDNIQWVE